MPNGSRFPALYSLAERQYRHAARAARLARSLRVGRVARFLQRAADERRGRREPFRVVVPRPGGDVAFHMDPVLGTDNIVTQIAQHGWHAFERPCPDVFAAACARWGGRVLDVGANTGFYSLLATAVHPTIRTVAFEPYPPVARLLDGNVARHPGRSRIEIVRHAVGSEIGSAKLYVPDASHGLVESSSSLSATFKESTSTIEVPVTTLDAGIEQWSGTTIVKIDVEGFEHAVLQGAVELLRRYQPVVFIEILPRAELDSISAIQLELGYIDVRLRPTEAIIGEAIAFDPDGWNHMLVPAAMVGEARRLLAEASLSVA